VVISFEKFLLQSSGRLSAFLSNFEEWH
jgi:hypothetical protein